MGKTIYINSKPEISAIYFALLQCGYDYYAFEKDAGLVKAIEGFRIEKGMHSDSFFMGVKQSSCKVYSYWPRAAALETATFYLDSNHEKFKNFNAYRENIMSASNISDAERNLEFWAWVKNFPAALSHVFKSKEFQAYFTWERKWIEQQNIIQENELSDIKRVLDSCEKYPPRIQKITIVLNPIKCAYSADYHLDGNHLIIISGSFKPDSVIHEYLHHIVHPFVTKHKLSILQYDTFYTGIDESYYLTGDSNGKINAFEEYAVRKLTDIVLTGKPPSDFKMFLREILNAK